MADMPSDFWAGWIAVITIVSLLGLAWLVFSIYFAPETEPEDAEGPVWDSNLREGSNPAPMWWFWLILAMMVFSVIYLMLYPGLGSYQGALKWSQGGDRNLAGGRGYHGFSATGVRSELRGLPRLRCGRSGILLSGSD
jgi:cytochrome c oxidase cbb3-type subunit 3